MDDDQLDSLADRLKTITQWFFSGLIDVLFVVAWAILQKMAGTLIEAIPLGFFDEVTKQIILILCAASTLTPIMIFIYKDIRITWIYAQEAINLARKKSEERLNPNAVSGK